VLRERRTDVRTAGNHSSHEVLAFTEEAARILRVERSQARPSVSLRWRAAPRRYRCRYPVADLGPAPSSVAVTPGRASSSDRHSAQRARCLARRPRPEARLVVSSPLAAASSPRLRASKGQSMHVSAHRRSSSPLAFCSGKGPLWINLSDPSIGKREPRRLSHLASIVLGGAREPTDASDLRASRRRACSHEPALD
jgi:hypothetical protein